MDITPGSYVKVNALFEGCEEGDLTVYPNDIVKVTSLIDDEWVNGAIGDQAGIFPKSFCTALKLEPLSVPYGVALYDHDAHLHDELSFMAGDQITDLRCINSEWYEGTFKGKKGMFPSNFMSIVTPVVRRKRPGKPERPASLSEESLIKLRRRSNSTGRSSKQKDSPKASNLLSNSTSDVYSSKRSEVQLEKPEVPPRSSEPAPVKPGIPPRKSFSTLEKPEIPPRYDPPPPPIKRSPERPALPPQFSGVSADSSIYDMATDMQHLSPNGAPTQQPVGRSSSPPSKPPDRPPALPPDNPPLESPCVPANNPPDKPPSLPPDDPPRIPLENSSTSEDCTKLQRPPVLDPDTVQFLRNRAGSYKKAVHEISTTPPRESDVGADEDENLPPTPPWTTPFADSGVGISVVSSCIPDQLTPEVETDDNLQHDEYYEETEYANDGDIISVANEYELEKSPDSKKLLKKIEAVEGEIRDLEASKRETEELLGQQFSGKKVDHEAVVLLQSLLKSQKEKLHELMLKLDTLKTKANHHKNTEGPIKAVGIEKRDKVVVELVSTEEMHVKHIQLCISGFIQPLRSNPNNKMDIDKVFLNMENILALSSRLLMMLKGQVTLMSHEQMIGRCFTHLEQELHEEYTFYLENHMHVMSLVSQYELDKTNAAMLNDCLLNIKDESTCWDLQSYLIRPVQRVMKYPLLLKEMLAETPTHWPDRPFLISALKICDNIVTYANENKRKEELLRRYNNFDTGSLLPRLSLHSVKKKSKRFTTSVTHTLNITNSIAADKEFQGLTEQFASIHTITKTLMQEAAGFTSLIKEIQEHMQALCNSIHDFYDDLTAQKDVFLYHAVALKIAQTYTPRFIEDLEGGPLQTLNELLECFTRPLLLVEKRNSKVLDYDNIVANSDNPDSMNENMRIARGEFEALHEQLVEDLPVLVEEGAKIVEKSAYSVLALYCQYARLCYDELKQTLSKMSLNIADVPDSIVTYHRQRMEESCNILLDICSFEAEVTHAIVRGGTLKHRDNESNDVEAEVLEEKIRKSDTNVAMWLTDDYGGAESSGNLNEAPAQPVSFTEDSETDEEKSCNTLQRLDTSPLPDVTLTGSISLTNEDDIPDLMGNAAAGTECMVMFDFVPTTDGAISVKEGARVTLVTECKEEESWCYVQTSLSQRGYVPKSFLVKVEDCGYSAPPTTTSTLKSKRKAPAPPAKTTHVDNRKPSVTSAKTLPRNKTSKKAPLAPKRSAPAPQVPTIFKPPQPANTTSESPEASPDPGQRRSSLVPKRAAPKPPGPKKPVASLSVTTQPVVSIPSTASREPDPSDSEITITHHHAANLLLDLSNCDIDDSDSKHGDRVSISSSQSSFLTADENFTPVEEPSLPDVEPEPELPPTPESYHQPENVEESQTQPETSKQTFRIPDSDSSLIITSVIRKEEEMKVQNSVHANQSKVSDTEADIKTDELPSSPNKSTSPELTSDILQPQLSSETAELKAPIEVQKNPATSDVFLCSNISTEPPRPLHLSVSVDEPKLNTKNSKNSGKPSVPESPLPKIPSKNSKSKPRSSKGRSGSNSFDVCPEEFIGGEAGGPSIYRAQYNYAGRSFTELSLTQNQTVEVLNTSDEDWWWIKVGKREGYVPAAYLKKQPQV